MRMRSVDGRIPPFPEVLCLPCWMLRFPASVPLHVLFALREMPSQVTTRPTSMEGIPTGKEERLSYSNVWSSALYHQYLFTSADLR